jgi:hypothetical protein
MELRSHDWAARGVDRNQLRAPRFSVLFMLALMPSIAACMAPLTEDHHEVHSLSTSGPIVSGTAWPDNNGNNVQGHGGNIIKVGSTYYWVGEDKLGEDSSNATFQRIPCYSSTDLSTSFPFTGARVRRTSTPVTGGTRATSERRPRSGSRFR